MSDSNNNTIFITGGAGYVASMLTTVLLDKDRVESIILLDKEERPDTIPDDERITYIQKNLCGDWQKQVATHSPDVVVHTAWQIREMYWDQDLQHRWNIGGSKNVFSFAFNTESVDHLIHFSTVASYGAFSGNSRGYRFTESDELRDCGYSYADQKKQSEQILKQMHESQQENADQNTQVSILRPASITGPWGRNVRDKFGLQSALSGQLDTDESFWHWLIDTLLFFTPVTKKWARQFVHEDDVINIITNLIFKGVGQGFATYNLAPPGPVVTGDDMAEAVGKSAVSISPQLIRFVFFWVRHLSLGKIPTSAGTWKTYSYPIVVDGSKVTKDLNYEYNFTAHAAFTDDSGRFAEQTQITQND